MTIKLTNRVEVEVFAAAMARLIVNLNAYYDEEEIEGLIIAEIDESREPNGNRFLQVNSMERLGKMIKATIEIQEDALLN